MKKISKNTKTFKVFESLTKGEKLTPYVAKNKLGVGNLSAEVSRIRAHGYAVYSTQVNTQRGKKITRYEIGRPSREIVALGYRAKQLGITLD